MHCTCVRQTELPHITRLAADAFYHPDRLSPFFLHPLRDLASFQAAANEIKLSTEQRAALVAALRLQNPNSPNLERLAQPGCVAVVTGQQVGLFSGPAYTIYKALHAARLAAWLTDSGVPAVPIFWLATEDHDFAEVNHVWLFGADHRPVRIQTRRSASLQPVGEIELSEPPLEALRAAIQDLPFGEEVASMVTESYQPGNSMGGSFGHLLRRLLEKYDILHVDPMRPEFRKLAEPTMRAAVEAAPGLNADVQARSGQLTSAGYHAQVHVEDQTSFFFLLENGKRLTLRRHGKEYVLNGRRFSTEELAERATSLSPNALLRPVIQDSVLPSVACIMGPGEMAYLAQSDVIYRTLLNRMPVEVPRSGFTILDSHSQKLLARYGLSLGDFFAGEEAVRAHIAGRLIPPSLASNLRESAETVDRVVRGMGNQLLAFDPTLAQAMEHSARKIGYQLAKIERKAGREAMRRDERVQRESAALSGLLCPERHLQERLYSILPFLAEHGLGLIDQIYEAIELECPDHRMMVV